ncbi:MAG: glycosyltransferase [Nitrosarchaeum sp.]|nr:MAG: glycosyltransferase [Nitrosarchaeum sp.]
MYSDLVSVIIPVYNSEKFLKESIESVLSQIYADIEIIVINDGSTDDSIKILNQYNDKIILIDQKNKGLSEAVNTGIKKMSGKWMKWLSPDDVLFPNTIEILVEEAKKLPENTIVYSNWEMIDEKGKKMRNFYESNYNNLDDFEFNVRLLNGQLINVNTVLIPASLFNKGCIMRTLNDTIAIDYDFFLRSGILYGTKFHLVEKNLLKYRIHKNQTSHKNIVKSLKYIDKIKKEILSKLDEITRNKYNLSLKKYSKNKKIEKKLMEIVLEIIKNFLPESLSEKILLFYINKIRSRR